MVTIHRRLYSHSDAAGLRARSAHSKIDAMVSSARHPRSAMLADRLLIMRLITGFGLALLLMLGLASTGHGQAESATWTLPGSIELTDAHFGGELSFGPEHAATGETAQTDSSSLMGAALCVLGVLCGLMLAVLVRTLRRRIPPAVSEPRRVHSGFRVPSVRARRMNLSLSQLGISRT